MSVLRALARRWTKAPARHQGTVTVPGLRADVVINRDRYGIPHIEAASDVDAWFACGFCQGQDRPFQLETRVRLVRGTLAELVGRTGVGLDLLARRIGFARAGEAQLDALSPRLHEVVDAFAAGLTQGTTAGRRRRGVPFSVLFARPSQVRGADILAMQGLMSFLIGSNWDGELARLLILTHDGPEALQDLEPARAPWLATADQVPVGASDVAQRLVVDLERFAAAGGGPGASNAWAVAGSRTASGRALVANDPHLSPDLPPHWYLAHARTPDWSAAGAQLIGAPGFVVGHNDDLAWGVTAGYVANTELFVEELSTDGTSVRTGDRWEPVRRRSETIRVRGGRNQQVEITETPRGPLVTDLFGTAPAAVAFDAVWRHPRPTIGFLDAHRATSLDGFFERFSAWPGPALNVVAGDSTGRVAWRLVGEVPARTGRYAMLPATGADTPGWGETTIPFAEMPTLVDPPTGYVVTANNRPSGATRGPYLGDDFLDGYRASRIAEQLDDRADWSVAATQQLQTDRHSLVWRDVRQQLLAAVPPSGPRAAAAHQGLALLGAWDGDEATDSVAATVFEATMAVLGRRVATARAPQAAAWLLGHSPVELLGSSLWSGRRIEQVVALLRDEPAGWFARPWPAEVGDALATAVEELTERFGSDTATWPWGSVRQLTFQHPLGRFGPLGKLFDLGPIPWGGSGQTVNAGGVSLSDITARPGAVASLRFVTEVGDWATTRVSLPGGQSGDIQSAHYADLLPFWVAGRGVPLAWTRDEVAVATAARLRLSSRGAGSVVQPG